MTEMTLGDHAEAWWKDIERREVPKRNTTAWREMYELWIAYAFADIRNPTKTPKQTKAFYRETTKDACMRGD